MRRKLFSEILDDFMPEIQKLSRKPVPGMRREDVEAEMILALWNARLTYAPSKNDNFGAYWWGIWSNRRTDLIIYHFRAKRDITKEILESFTTDSAVPEEAVAFFVEPDIVPPPPSSDPTERRIWELLAIGATPKEVQEGIGITKPTYYALISSWRTEIIRKRLE